MFGLQFDVSQGLVSHTHTNIGFGDKGVDIEFGTGISISTHVYIAF